MKMNTTSLALALLVTVTGQVLYHVVARGSGATKFPFELVAIAYFMSFCVVVAIGISLNQISTENIPTWDDFVRGCGLGIAVACVEVGYIYAYRSGLPISTGALGVLAVTTLVLAPIGVIFFSEALTARMILGGIMTIIGVWLMRAA